MASEEVVDFESLLAAISEADPVGVSLRGDAELAAKYYDVRDARKAARDAEKRHYHVSIAGEEDGAPPLEKPNWNKVVSAACEVLSKHSKDLWITAWLIEGLTRQHGFAGLRDGFRLAKSLCENFWDQGIHPRPDEEEQEEGLPVQVAQIEGLNNSLPAAIDLLEITDNGGEGFSSLDYKGANELEAVTDPESRQRRIEDGFITKAEFDKAVRSTPQDFFHNLYEDVQQCQEEYDALCEVLEQKCGTDKSGYSLAPRSSDLKQALEDCRHCIEVIAPFVLVTEEADGEAGGLMVSGNGANAGPVSSREDAFRALNQVADFFERTEPHSPVSYSLRQVVRWGRMSLSELLSELIADTSARDDLFRRAGIPQPGGNDNDQEE